MWDEITYPFPNFNGCTIEVWDKWFHLTLYLACDYLSVLGLKLIDVCKRSHRGPQRMGFFIDCGFVFLQQ